MKYPGITTSGVTVRPYNSLLLVFFAIITLSITACTPSQKTRPPETLEAISKDFCLTLMTYNIRVGAGRENLLMPVKYLNSSGKKLEKIALAIKSIDPVSIMYMCLTEILVSSGGWQYYPDLLSPNISKKSYITTIKSRE
jgi:hypothetical protein